ncbi:class 1b ribonucleoside-diphosphate reductase subunit beta [Rhodococcus olei]|uniref:ribonucleoside-diphosphate reductase n=1 Tax=Rhodococcus olei TaxID=2161675 RepID=A0ABP8PQB4_9NOCA
MGAPGTGRVHAIDWTRPSDPTDVRVWDRLTGNFWLPERVPLSNDVPSWRALTDTERRLTIRVFTGLTLLDTAQATVGAVSMIADADTAQEAAVLTNMAFMESVHAKSYSAVFSTLCSSREIDEAFDWSERNAHLQRKAGIVLDRYRGDDPLARKAASVLLESFLFYSGFYLPLRFASRGVLTNTGDLIRLIMRDEAVHGYYIGHACLRGLDRAGAGARARHRAYTLALLGALFDNEVGYAHDLYDEVGWTGEVLAFMRYNANRALANLGYGPRFAAAETVVRPEILAALDPGAGESHDFFSGAGSAYVVTTPVPTEDADWEC